MLRELALLAVWLAPALAQKTGTFEIAGETKISAMMMFVGNEEKVYILDKAEGNAARAPIGDRPAWGAVWDVNTRKVDLMDVRTNVFCASGMHLPNGSWATFGGNGAVGPGGGLGDIGNVGYQAGDDSTYKNLAGQKAIRLLDVCKTGEDFTSDKCKWFDDPTVLAMQKQRWYSSAEPLGDGTIVMIGGFVNGGYINRNWPNVDPAREGGAAEPTYEFFPPNGQEAQVMQFMIKTSGLNSYAHAYMMPSGRMFVQANISTTLWDVQNNRETALPDMPKGIARVYPASGAVGMLPLTPENNYNPTILFCGGTDMPDEAWGNYLHPFINTWLYPASKDCQRITPEPTDGSAPVYEQDDDMLEGRTMGEFVILADGKFLLLNGAANGTAGYADATRETPIGQMPFGMSLASAPTLKPVIYDPTAAKGKRWSDAGLSASTIPRLYHSSALLLPDGSVLVAGSNPNVDVNFTVPFPTEYRAEIFYPSYLSASVRPEPTGIPSTLSYGGASFDITIPASSYSGSSNTAADSIKINVIRSGWVTHAMSMGRRFLTLRHTYTVQNDGSIVVHVSQMPPNANIFQPGPAFVHVLVNGIPSVGKYVIVGSGKIERQPLAQDATLPTNVRLDSARGSADGSQTGTGNGNNNNSTTPGSSADNGSSKAMSTGAIIGAAAGAAAVLALLGAVLFFLCRRRRPAATRDQAGPAMSTRHGDGATYEGLGTNYGPPSPGLYTTSALGGAAGGVGSRAQFMTNADSNMGPPQANPGADWRNGSSVSLLSPSNVERTSSPGYYDPYAERHSGRH